MSELAAQVLALLRARGQTLGAAESLTGGLVVAALTGVAGSSDVVRGGVVSYAREVKTGLLGVPAPVVEGPGVVSRACAEAMAAGVRAAVGADWGLATTGVAGPGPADGHPAGTVHIAVEGPGPVGAGDGAGHGAAGGESTRAHRMLHLDGSRTQVREATVKAVLELLLQLLEVRDRARDRLSDPRQGPLSVALGTVGVTSVDDGDEEAKEG